MGLSRCVLALVSLLPGQAAARELHQDFRSGKPLVPALKLIGELQDSAAGGVKREEEGLRVTLPAHPSKDQSGGVQARFRLTGDFEITGAFEFLGADPPDKGYGAGVGLIVSPNHQKLVKFAKVGRFLRVREGSVYFAESWNKDVPGSYRGPSLRTDARAGRLRLTRTGSLLRFLAADGADGEFRELQSVDFGTEDLGLVNFTVNTNKSTGGVDARLVSLDIRNGGVPDDAFDPRPPVAPAEAEPANGLLIGLTLSLAATLSLGAWLGVRRRWRLAPEDVAADEPTRAAVAASATRRWWWLPIVLLALAQAVALCFALSAEGGEGGQAGDTKKDPVGETKKELAGELSPRSDTFREYHHKFVGQNRGAFTLVGPAAEQRVRFEAEGLRFKLPPGWGGERPNTGVKSGIGAKGDFEITMSFEILEEPGPAEAGQRGTRLTMEVLLDTPHGVRGTTSRTSMSNTGDRVFIAWMSRWRDEEKAPPPIANFYPTECMTGRLRLTRIGPDLFYYVAEGTDGPFKRLRKNSFGAEDVTEINIVASTGGAKAMLDARVTDLRIRAETLSNVPETELAAPTSAPLATPEGGSRWLLAVVIGVLVMAALVLGVWLYARSGSKTAARHGQGTARNVRKA